jgi:excisionase family DNA binding protein
MFSSDESAHKLEHSDSLVFENQRGISNQQTPSFVDSLTSQKWLNAREAAQYLRTSVGSVRNMVYRGQLTPYKPFGRLLFNRCELDRAIEISRNGGR